MKRSRAGKSLSLSVLFSGKWKKEESFWNFKESQEKTKKEKLATVRERREEEWEDCVGWDLWKLFMRWISDKVPEFNAVNHSVVATMG